MRGARRLARQVGAREVQEESLAAIGERAKLLGVVGDDVAQQLRRSPPRRLHRRPQLRPRRGELHARRARVRHLDAAVVGEVHQHEARRGSSRGEPAQVLGSPKVSVSPSQRGGAANHPQQRDVVVQVIHLVLVLVPAGFCRVFVVAVLHEVPVVAPKRLLVCHANVGEGGVGSSSLDVSRGEGGVENERRKERGTYRVVHARGVDFGKGRNTLRRDLGFKLFVEPRETERGVEENLVVASKLANHVSSRLFLRLAAAAGRFRSHVLGNLLRELKHQPPPRVAAQLCRVVARRAGSVPTRPSLLGRRPAKLVPDQDNLRRARVRRLGDALRHLFIRVRVGG
mmetsp:Transcript_10210/g.41281  ORF Transcript_10210/g.41281 Transcript_10210/m.41281 type:complete len:341 (+) Transcript_10210:1422-2444(+)